MQKLTKLLLLIFCLGGWINASAQVGHIFEDWSTTEGTQNFFIQASVVTDADGYVYVAGATLNSAGNYDVLVAKYDGGEVLWVDQYDGAGNGHDAATAITLDGSGGVYVTGTTFSSSTDTADVVTIGYDGSTGSRLWEQVYAGSSGLADMGTGILFLSGDIYVGGYATDASNSMDYLALKYSTDGTLQWSQTYDHSNSADISSGITTNIHGITLVGATHASGLDWDYLSVIFDFSDGSVLDYGTASGGSVGFEHVRAVEKDALGNIYLTGTVNNGTTGYDIHTVKIDSDLNVVWDADYSGSGSLYDEGTALAVDASGNVYVGGYKTTTGQGTDFVTLYYDDTGSLQYSVAYNDTSDGADTLKSIVVDGSGNVTVTGTAWNGSSFDYHTIQYDNAASMRWEQRFNDKYNYTDVPMDMATTPDGGIVVTGQSLNPDSTMSYITVKYVELDFVMPVDSDSISTSLRWIANRDQLLGSDGDPVERVRFYSNQCYPNVYMMNDTLSYVFAQGVDTTNDDTLHRIDMTFAGSADGKQLRAIDKETYWNNYYLGHIPEGRPFVSLYKHLYMQDVWPNIDVEYSTNQRGLKYYFVVHPGGETGAIALDYHGQDALSVDGNGALVIESSIGELVQPQALAYEMDGSGELTLLGWQPDYVVSSGQVSLDGIGSYSGDLVIEVNWGYVGGAAGGPPAFANLNWSTQVGAEGSDYILDIEKGHDDGDGNGPDLYVGGKTQSTDFAAHININEVPQQGAALGLQDAFVIKFNGAKEAKWYTYLGGDHADAVTGLAFSPTIGVGNLGFCGYADNGTIGALEPSSHAANAYIKHTFSGGRDAVYGQLHPVTGTLIYLQLIGGEEDDEASSILTDLSGNFYITGTTDSYNAQANTSSSVCIATTGNNFPLCDAGSNTYYQATHYGTSNSDIFIAKFDIDFVLKWSTFYGSSENDFVFDATLAMTTPPNILICGKTAKTSTGANSCGGNLPSNGDFPLCDQVGTGDYSQMGSGSFISRFDNVGNLLWATNVNNIKEFQTITSSENYFYAVGLTEVLKPSSGGVNSCSPPSGIGEFPICTPSGSYVQSNGRSTFVAKFGFADNGLKWSTLFGDGRPSSTYSGPSTDIFGGPSNHPLKLVNPAVAPVAKHMDAVASSDDNFFIVGTTLEELDVEYFAGCYNQATNHNTDGVNIPDVFIAYFNEGQDLKWATLFGGGDDGANGAIYTGNTRGYPRYSEFATSIDLRNHQLTIAGYSGGKTDGGPIDFPYADPCPGSTPCSGSDPYYKEHYAWGAFNFNLDGFVAEFDENILVGGQESTSTIFAHPLLYPNPAQTSFDIILPHGVHSCKIQILNVAGQIVISKSDYRVGSPSIEIRTLPAGLYLVNLTSENWSSTEKLIKE